MVVVAFETVAVAFEMIVVAFETVVVARGYSDVTDGGLGGGFAATFVSRDFFGRGGGGGGGVEFFRFCRSSRCRCIRFEWRVTGTTVAFSRLVG